MAKIEICPFYLGHSCTTLWVKHLLEIALSLTVFEIFTLFHFSLKSRIATNQKWRKLNFSPLHMMLLCYPAGQNFARNRSITYGFRNIHTFSFSAKIQDGRSKSLYLLQFSRYSHFFLFRKNPRWPPKVAKIEIFPFCIGLSCTRVKNSLVIPLSRTVFEIFKFCH